MAVPPNPTPLKIVECPRDAMQGLKPFIPTELKAEYLNKLLKVGFDTLDFGSFVSPKAIPQMKDTAEVLRRLDLSATKTSLLAIVANQRGAEKAASFEEIAYLGYPFSLSETFQLRNTNASIEESLARVEDIYAIAGEKGKQLVVYLSMGFGNPYGDPWNVEIVKYWVGRLHEQGIRIMQLSDTIGVATPASIHYLFADLSRAYDEVEIGAHFHTTPSTWREKIEAALESGCRRFDGAIRGYGGCPMARDELTGNMPTENMVAYFNEHHEATGIDREAFGEALAFSVRVFPPH